MRLIVTRPEPAASKTAKKLRALGHDVTISPVLKIIDSGLDIPQGPFTAVIITSSNALRIMEQRGIEQALLQTPLYVVGDRTAAKAKEIGFETVLSASGNANNLIELLNAHADDIVGSKCPVLYVCGADATSGFIENLHKMGLKVVSWVNYKANLVDQLTKESAELIHSNCSVGVLLYSTRTAKQFSQLFTTQLSIQAFDKITFFAISKNVKSALDQSLQKHCLVALKPDETSLFGLIQD